MREIKREIEREGEGKKGRREIKVIILKTHNSISCNNFRMFMECLTMLVKDNSKHRHEQVIPFHKNQTHKH